MRVAINPRENECRVYKNSKLVSKSSLQVYRFQDDSGLLQGGPRSERCRPTDGSRKEDGGIVKRLTQMLFASEANDVKAIPVDREEPEGSCLR